MSTEKKVTIIAGVVCSGKTDTMLRLFSTHKNAVYWAGEDCVHAIDRRMKELKVNKTRRSKVFSKNDNINYINEFVMGAQPYVLFVDFDETHPYVKLLAAKATRIYKTTQLHRRSTEDDPLLT